MMRHLNPTHTITLVAALAITVITLSILGAKPAFADTPYSGGELIDDPIFLNATSMGTGQTGINSIQSFLSSKGSFLASYNSLFDCSVNILTNQQTINAYQQAGAPCGQTVSAATIIYYASQVYGINPQAVLATMQKEQSIITAPTFDQYKVNYAMGYGCPDSGGCSTTPNSNFLYQLDNGTGWLRINYERARGNMTYWFTSTSWTCGSPKQYYTPSLYPKQNVTFYDDNGVAYATYWIANTATSSLYCYTPHAYNNPQGLYGLPTMGTTGLYYSGSYNFVKYFNLWFGLPFSSPLIKGSGPTVYLVGNDESVAYGVPSGAVLDAYGLSGMPVTTVSDSYIASLNTTGMLTTLFMKPGDTTIYLADGGKMYGIASNAVCTQWDLACGQANLVSTLPANIIKTLSVQSPLGNLMRSNGTIFYMNNGTKQPFLNNSDLSLSPWSTEQPTTITSPLNSSQPAGTPELFGNHFIHLLNGTIYYYDATSGTFFTFSSFDTFKNWWDGSTVLNDQYSSFNTSPPSATLMPSFVLSGSTYYAVSGSTKLSMPSPPSAPVLDLASYPGVTPLVNSKTSLPVDSTHAIRFSNGFIGMIIDGTLRPLASLTDVALLVGQNVTNNVPAAIETAYPNGKLYIPAGRIVKVDGAPTIYLTDDSDNLWALSNMGDVNAALNWVDNGLNLNSADMSISSIKTYNGVVKTGGSYYAVQNNGTLRQLPSNLLSSQKDNVSIPISGPVAQLFRYDTRPLSFISFSGTIFAVQDNQLHYIGLLSTFFSLGGSDSNTINLPVSALAMFTVGDPL